MSTIAINPPVVVGQWTFDGKLFDVGIQIFEEKLLTQIATACNRSDGQTKLLAGGIVIKAKAIGPAPDDAPPLFAPPLDTAREGEA